MYTDQQHRRPRRRWQRTTATLAALGISLGTVGIATGTANALAPANDNYANRATLVKDTAVNISFVEATIEPAIENEAGVAACGFDAITAFPNAQTLWFDYTPTVSETLDAAVEGTGFLSGVAVTGDPGSFAGVACSLNPVFDVVAGVTYHIMAVDLLGSSADATITLTKAAPPPTLTATIDPLGSVDQANNVVTLSGTYACTSQTPTGPLSPFGAVEQTRGRFFVSAFGGDIVDPTICDGASHKWNLTTQGNVANGLFRPGPSSVTLGTFQLCNARCTNTTVPPATVTLKSVKAAPTPPPPAPSPTAVKVTVDRNPVLDRATGLVTLSGTFSCTAGDEAFLTGRLHQVVSSGMFVDAIVNADLGQCDGTTQRWSAVASQLAFGFVLDRFAGGMADFNGTAVTCSIDGACANDVAVSTSVRIRAVGQWGGPHTVLPHGVAVNFDHRAKLDTSTNTVTATGNVSCSPTDAGNEVWLLYNEIAQLVGNVNVRSTNFAFAQMTTCDGLPHAFSFTATGQNGRFAGGKAVGSAVVAIGTVDPNAGFFIGSDSGIAQADLRLVPLRSKK